MELSLETTSQADKRVQATREVQKTRNVAILTQQRNEAQTILTVPGYGVEIRKS